MTKKRFLILSFFFCLLGAWILILPIGLHPSEMLPGGAAIQNTLPQGDLPFFLFSLWWDGYSVFNLHTHPWFCPLMGAPEGVSLLYSTIVPLAGVISYPLFSLFNGIFIYNLWYIGGIAMLPFLSLCLVRTLGGTRTGAILTAGLLLLAPLVAAHKNHLNILSAWTIPLVLLAQAHLWRRRSWRAALLLALSLGVVFYISAYHTIHSLIFLGLDTVWRVWHFHRGLSLRMRRTVLSFAASAFIAIWIVLSLHPPLGAILLAIWIGALLLFSIRLMTEKRRLRKILVLTICAAAATTLLWSPFFLVAKIDRRQQKASVRMDLTSKSYWSAQPLLYVLSPRLIERITATGRLGGNDLLRLDGRREFSVFPGYAFWALLVWILWRTRAPRARQWIAAAAVFMVLSFGPCVRWGKEIAIDSLPEGVIALPALAFDFLPLLEGYRVFARMAFGVHIALAVFIGLAWRREILVAPSWRPARWTIFTALCIALILVERAEWPAPAMRVRVPAIYEDIARLPAHSTLVEFPAGRGHYLYPLTLHRHRLVNKYVSRDEDHGDNQTSQNLFIWFLRHFDHPKPASIPKPDGPADAQRLRRDFDLLQIDAAIVHLQDIPPEKREIVRRSFENALGLTRILEKEEILLYENPRRNPTQRPATVFSSSRSTSATVNSSAAR